MTANETIQRQRAALAPILRKLRTIRKRIALWFTFHGLVRVFTAAIIVFGLDLLLDRFLQMDRAQRSIMLVLMLGFLGWVFWRKLLQPLLASISDDALVVELERHGGKDSREAVLSALELGRMDWSKRPEVSPALVQAAIARGAKTGREIPVDSVVREDRLGANFACTVLLGLILLAAAIAALVRPDGTLGIWAKRNLLLQNANWPQDHEFQILGAEDGIVRIPRGDDWTITALVREGAFALPQSVRIEYDRDGSRRTEGMTDTGERREFTAYLPPVSEEFTFRIASNKVTTEWFQAKIVDRPRLGSLTLTVTPPAYTGADAAELAVGSGPYKILAGSTLKVEGTTDIPVASARLDLPERPVTLALDEARTSFTGEAPTESLTSGSCILDVDSINKLAFPGETKARGLGFREPVRFRIRVVPDKAPTIQARLAGVSGLATVKALVPLTAILRDDYGLDSARLVYTWKGDAADAEEKEGTSSLELPADASVVELEDTIDIEALGVETGSRLSLRVEATDNDTVSGPKAGLSTRLLLRIVTEAELRTDFLRREKEQQQALTALIEKQDLLSTDIRAFSAETRNDDLLSASNRSRLSGFEKQQSRITAEINGVIASLERIVEEILINRLPDEEDAMKNRLRDRAMKPLVEAREKFSPEAAAQLDLARLPAADPDARAQAIGEAALAQSQVIGKLKQTLRHLVKNEDFQLAVNMLYDLQKSQEEVLRRTQLEKKKRVEELLKEDEKKEP